MEEIVKQPEMVSDRMRSTCAEDMNKMGLEVISFTIKEVRDQNEYITNMGRPDIARIKRDADVATAEAERDTAMQTRHRTARSRRGKGPGRPGAGAGRDPVAGQAVRGAARPGGKEGASISRRVKKQQATADKSYEIQTNVMQQQLVVESVKVQKAEKEQQVLVQEAEIAAPRKGIDRDRAEAAPRSNASASKPWLEPRSSG